MNLDWDGWMIYRVLPCRACGEDRPCDDFGEAYRCLACGVLWDPSEASC
jgi:hypothetical protein